MSVTGFSTNASAATVSVTCQYLLCSNKLNATSPLKAGSSLPSGVPVYGGKKLSAIDSSLSSSDYHYVALYCSDFGDTTLKKRHTFSIVPGYHKYITATNEYKQVHAGESAVKKFLDKNGRPVSNNAYNEETGKYDIPVEYIEKSNEFYWHYRKYLCGGTHSTSAVVNVSSGNAVSAADAKTALSSLGGCSDEFYAIETHKRIHTYIGHNSPKGGFIMYTESDGSSASVYYKELIYDSSTEKYKIPGSECYINKTDLPADSDTWGMLTVKMYKPSGEYKYETFFTSGATCGYRYDCNECGWSQTGYGAGYPASSLKSKNSTTHTFITNCASCGKLLSTNTENHNFEYSNYNAIVNSDETSTKHTVDRKCKTTKKTIFDSKASVCGYSDTITESHTWTYSDYKKNGYDTHTCTRTCSGCGYSETITENHSLIRNPETGYTPRDADSHTFTESCPKCNYLRLTYQKHTFITSYSVYSSEKHSIMNACECGYEQDVSYGDHHDDNGDCYCDDCGYLMTMFSVTVPSTMALVMDKNGNVYSAENASITNNSTDSVKVSSVKVTGQNGWTVTDYNTNMANEKVDSKKIGFKMNESTTNSNGEFSMNDAWNINKGSSLALPYTAVVSATSTPINNQEVLKIVFIIDWSDG